MKIFVMFQVHVCVFLNCRPSCRMYGQICAHTLKPFDSGTFRLLFGELVTPTAKTKLKRSVSKVAKTKPMNTMESILKAKDSVKTIRTITDKRKVKKVKRKIVKKKMIKKVKPQTNAHPSKQRTSGHVEFGPS